MGDTLLFETPMFQKRVTNPALSELREDLTATLEADPQNRCTVQFSTAQAYDCLLYTSDAADE